MTPADFFPQIAPWVESLPNTWPGSVIKPQFASWEVFHILSLVILGGASILLNLRLIGVGLTNETPAEVQRNLKLWINIGVVGIVVSGVLIGLANAERLYNSTAFTVKMLALLAGVIFTYGASGPVAKADGQVGRTALIWWIVGLVVFLFGLWVFATTVLINPGLFHMLTAAGLIVLFVTRGRLRWVYLSILALLMAGQFVLTHLIIDTTDFARTDPVNKTFAGLYTACILGFAVYRLVGGKHDPESRPLAQVIGFVTILTWIVGAAAGRWIAFA
jgi:hypothetical protein